MLWIFGWYRLILLRARHVSFRQNFCRNEKWREIDKKALFFSSIAGGHPFCLIVVMEAMSVVMVMVTVMLQRPMAMITTMYRT